MVAPLLLAVAAAGNAPGAVAQEPPDTLPADTRPPAADSLAGDTLSAESDSAPPLPPLLPAMPDPAPAGLPTGIREWNREELLGARGQTLWELLAEAPGVLAIRGGDFGSPVAVVPHGYAGGAIRVYLDGVEQLPLEGSIPDLARIPVSGLERVRMIRRPGGLEIHLHREDHAGPEAFTLIEAGTGDLDSNLLRGTFSFPQVVAGKAALAIERLDTRGREMPGAVTGAWFRYSLHRGDSAGIRFEARRMATERTGLDDAPGTVTRSDRTLQGVWAPFPWMLAEAWTTRGSLATGDSTETFPFLAESRGQEGGRLSFRRGPVWGRATARWNRGTGLPERELAAELSGVSERWGGVRAGARRERWGEEVGVSFDLNGWFTPIPHMAVFAERGGGRRGVPWLNPLPPEQPDSATADPDSATSDPEGDSAAVGSAGRFTDRTGLRIGARAHWRGLEVSGARVSVEADSIWPTGLPFDRGGLVRTQPRREGWELSGAVPLRPAGLFFVGEVQLWDPADSLETLYFPEHSYRGGLSLHRVFRESRNFELWVDLGAEGRAPMRVPQGVPPEPAIEDSFLSAAPPGSFDDDPALVPDQVPFYQSWYFRLQMRILTINIFATVDNLSLRRGNRDVPGRLLPGTRAFYGVRWIFRN